MAVAMPPSSGVDISLADFPDFAALGAVWRTLEPEVAGLSFFQSWTWLGCLAAERFPDPVILRATREGRTVGLALFNRRGRRLHLSSSGDPVHDSPFIEHNAPLAVCTAPGHPPIGAALLRAAFAITGAWRLVLPGTPPWLAAAAGGHVLRRQERSVPFVDLERIRAGGGDYLATRSANTRAQIRRSLRHYERRGGLELARATTAAQAAAWLEALIELHDATWRRRGSAGAFATPFARRFHATLVVDALGRDELDLLRLTAGGEVVGYLYNFRLRGRVSAYQSGLAYRGGATQEKPGLCLHALAVEKALREGLGVYDFLAGADRYKLSLATGSTTLAWTELARPGLWGRAQAAVRAGARALLRRLRPPG
jgi:CelD/BcsL family acetyltransferase involved in cellulose biosynthesis